MYSVTVLLSLDNVLLRSCLSETPFSDSICTSRRVASVGWINKPFVSFIFLFYFCLFFTHFVKPALVTKWHVVCRYEIREIHVATSPSPLVSDDGDSLWGVRIDLKRCIQVDNMIFFDTTRLRPIPSSVRFGGSRITACKAIDSLILEIEQDVKFQGKGATISKADSIILWVERT